MNQSPAEWSVVLLAAFVASVCSIAMADGESRAIQAGNCTIDADCSDGDPCNGAEACVDSQCAAGTPLPNGTPCADDGNQCTTTNVKRVSARTRSTTPIRVATGSIAPSTITANSEFATAIR